MDLWIFGIATERNYGLTDPKIPFDLTTNYLGFEALK
jgi:hypothetical protein